MKRIVSILVFVTAMSIFFGCKGNGGYKSSDSTSMAAPDTSMNKMPSDTSKKMNQDTAMKK